MSGGLKIQFVDNSATQYNGSAHAVLGVEGLNLKGRLWLGDRDSASFLQLRHRKVTHVVNCEKDIHGSSKEEGITYLNIDPEEDEGASFELALAFIDKHCGDGGSATVLVHCLTGNGRSAGVVLYYLMKRANCTLAEAHRALKKTKPTIAPRAGLVRLLLAEERKLFRGLESISLNDKRQIIYKDDMFAGPGGADKKGGGKRGGGWGGVLGLGVLVAFFLALYFGLSLLAEPKTSSPRKPAGARKARERAKREKH